MLWQAAFGKPLLDKHVTLELGKRGDGNIADATLRNQTPCKILGIPGKMTVPRF